MRRTFVILAIICFLLFSGIPDSVRPVSAWQQQDALTKARDYLETMDFSASGLIDQLIADGFSSKEALYAVQNCGADWNAEAVKKAKALLEDGIYSQAGMAKQLEADGFTKEESAYGAENCGASWDDMAVRKAQSYMSSMFFSEYELIDQLINDGFTRPQAVYAADSGGIDWNAAALKQAERHLNAGADPEELIELLELDGFSAEQARYGAENAKKALAEGNEGTAAAEELQDPRAVSEAVIEVLNKDLMILFPIQSLKDSFTTYMVPTYSDIGPDSIIQTRNQDGERKIYLVVNTDLVHDRGTVEIVNSGNLVNFLFSMDVHVNDVFPQDQGGCFIAYTNEYTKADPDEEAETVALLANEKGVEFYRKTPGSDTGTHQQISDVVSGSYKLTLVRLTGLTFAFIDGKFAGQFYDDSSGPFRLVYGSTVFSRGDNAYCSFDNLAVRKVNN